MPTQWGMFPDDHYAHFKWPIQVVSSPFWYLLCTWRVSATPTAWSGGFKHSPKISFSGLNSTMTHFIKWRSLSHHLQPSCTMTKKPVVLQVDASESGVVGALLQPNTDNKLQPVAFTSSSISEKECLAICNCFHKFDQLLYGKQDIEVHTNHKPLESIMQKPPNEASTCLQWMLMQLQRCQFKSKYKPGPTRYILPTLCPEQLYSTLFHQRSLGLRYSA